MPNIIDISMLGDKALTKKLGKLPGRLQKKVLRQAMRKAAKPILADIKQSISSIRVTGLHTDPLKKKTKIKSLKRSRNKIGVRITTPTRDELGIPADSKWYWPAHIELGTSKEPAQPFMRGPFNAARQKTLTTIKQETGKGIIREAMKP